MGDWVDPGASLGHFEGEKNLLRLLEILVGKHWVKVT
jgi:hypothetical protein